MDCLEKGTVFYYSWLDFRVNTTRIILEDFLQLRPAHICSSDALDTHLRKNLVTHNRVEIEMLIKDFL
jgi:hypothetical protein